MGSRRLEGVVVAAMVAVTSSACVPGGFVGVSRNDSGELVFSANEKGSTEKECFESISVSKVSDTQNDKDYPDGDPIWEVMSSDPVCVGEVIYGRIPNGFRKTIDTEKLRVGETYSLYAVTTAGHAEKAFVF